MLIQRAGTGTLPPPGFTAPPWEILMRQWSTIPPPSTQTVLVGPATLSLGHHDSEADDQNLRVVEDVKGHTFGWDNESPERHVTVGAFKAEWRPISNHEFLQFWMGEGKNLGVQMPTSWTVAEDGDIKVSFLSFPFFCFQNQLTDRPCVGPNVVWTCRNGNRSVLACSHFIRRPCAFRGFQRRSLAD